MRGTVGLGERVDETGPRPGGERLLVPRQLPAPPVHFVNRLPELSRLDSVVNAGRGRTPGIAVLRGPGGIGKSALALNWLERVRRRFSDGELYAGLASSAGRPVAVEDVLGGFLRALGVAPDRVPSSLDERAALYRSVTDGRAVAVLLEDAVSAAQVKVLLPASADSLVVVTTRRPLAGLLTEGAVVVPVDPLDEAGAIELLERQVGPERVATEHRPTRTLVSLCAGFPLALSVVAAQLVLRPHRSTARLVDELRSERRRLDLSVEEDLSVRATFELSVRALPADAMAAYLAIGVQPGSLVCTELTAAACRMGQHRARQALDELVDASLLDEVDDGHYRCHDLVRAHARVEADERLDLDERLAVARRSLEWYLHAAHAAGRTVMPARPPMTLPDTTSRYELPDGLDQYAGALDWLERHRHDLAAAVRLSAETDQHALTHALGQAMQPLFYLHRHYRVAAEVHELAMDAAAAMGDTRAEAGMRRRLARVLVHLDELPRARTQIDTLLLRARETGDRRETAHAMKSLARLHSRRGEHHLAATALEEVAEILRGLGLRRSLALALIELGATLVEQDLPGEAVSHLDQARALLLALDPPDEYNAVQAVVGLADAQLRRGDHGAALALLTDALPVLSSLGSAYHLGRAHALLAELHTARGEHERAREHRLQADDLHGRVAGPERED
ncbi:tetratricopeptide repeat protein [Actinophytocola gossypii]|uniref:Tetratricopeptide repeat protein n=1 Tax=Actinophytocola gossypii TaxID=2812003 RepID=A0ABT2JGC6_9PSEU|nr:tetratricopeptide repeat protein [Actinophytocola gossypii]MCT2586928.1 tetratricopeptide repeat protein [Actinophytocola gossypii]